MKELGRELKGEMKSECDELREELVILRMISEQRKWSSLRGLRQH